MWLQLRHWGAEPPRWGWPPSELPNAVPIGDPSSCRTSGWTSGLRRSSTCNMPKSHVGSFVRTEPIRFIFRLVESLTFVLRNMGSSRNHAPTPTGLPDCREFRPGVVPRGGPNTNGVAYMAVPWSVCWCVHFFSSVACGGTLGGADLVFLGG